LIIRAINKNALQKCGDIGQEEKDDTSKLDEEKFIVGYNEFVKILNEETFRGDN
jgi:hypothetical protein